MASALWILGNCSSGDDGSCAACGSLCSAAEVYLYGACTTSWTLPSGEDLLFVRPDAVFTGKKPIR